MKRFLDKVRPISEGISAGVNRQASIAKLRRIFLSRGQTVTTPDRSTRRARCQAGYASGGEQQMYAIGRALMAKPNMVLLDEPSMGLAPQIVDHIFEIVHNINAKEGVSFLLAEQNTNVALRFATYGYILENGRIVMDGEAKTCARTRTSRSSTSASGAPIVRASATQELQATKAVARVATRDAFRPFLRERRD